MSKTFRGPERSQIAPKRLSAKKKKKMKKMVPAGSRRMDRAARIRKLEKAAERRGRDFDPKYYAMCYGKIAYKTEEETSKNNTAGTLTIPYKCEYCPYWHVGRRPKTDPLYNPHLWTGKAPRKKEQNERISITGENSSLS